MVDEQKLRELAGAATPGHWTMQHIGRNEWGAEVWTMNNEEIGHSEIAETYTSENAAYMAAANPATTLALLDELQTLRSERTAWRVTAENAEKDAAPQPVAQPVLVVDEDELRKLLMRPEADKYIKAWPGVPISPNEVALYAAPVTQAKPEQAAQQWQPIETAPKDGRTMLLGYFSSANKWRTMRGQWMSEDYISEYWEEPDGVEAGWFETVVEADEPPNCWPIDPTHWMPLPASPKPKD